MDYKALREKIELYFSSRCPMPTVNGRLFGYAKSIDTENYSIYELAKSSEMVVAAYGTMIVTQKKSNRNKLILYPFFQNRLIRNNIFINEHTFPGIIPGSKVLKAFFVPYIRIVGKDKYVKAVRLNIITDKAQIYHNYPARHKEFDGLSIGGDMLRFEESVIWDTPGRKFPVKDKSVSTYERYYPDLPDECYVQHPMSNTDINYHDKYGNGGFDKFTSVSYNGEDTQVSRFYVPIRTEAGNPFYFIGTGESNMKMAVIATYRSNVDVGVRICAFASDDGGRQWYCKYEFADTGEYAFQQGHSGNWGRNFGNPIINASYNNTYYNGLSVWKRELIVPSKDNPSPVNKFIWHESGKIAEIKQENQLCICTDVPHGLSTGNIVAIRGNADRDAPLAWLINNSISDISAGNGLLFKVEAVSKTEIKLYELVSSPDNNIPCRHIHHVNRIKDGWMLGTGEIYPNGWLFYISLRAADTYTPVKASDELMFYRLNSSLDSIQRTMGAYILENESNEILYASDHDTLEMHEILIPYDCNRVITRGSTGIYKITLSEIDIREKSVTVYETQEPCFYFQRINGVYIFGGQRGELAISFDNGVSWSAERTSNPIINFHGSVAHYYFFDSFFIRIK